MPALQARMRSMGEPEGINFTFGGKVGNTRDAHRLLELARTKGPAVQDGAVMALFRSYFEQGGDITDVKMLVDAGVGAGMERAEVERWMAEGLGGDEVDREVERAYAQGIHGVPSFEINGRWHVEGAQDVEAFLEEFTRAKEGA